MRLTRKNKALIAGALRAAKPLVDRGNGAGFTFICHALRATEMVGAGLAAKLICQRLAVIPAHRDDDGNTAVEWLLNQGIPTRLMTPENVQAWRLLWIDKLITEMES